MRVKVQTPAEELEYANERLKRSNRELEEFAYAVSHDLQEPIRAITSNCQLLLQRHSQHLGPEAQETLGFAIRGAKRMQNQIRGLLEYSRVGHEEHQIQWEEMDDIVREVVQNLAQAIGDTGARISIQPLPKIQCQRLHMVQLIQNLISNALKFHNGKAPEIEVSATKKGDEWIFVVRDNGIGIEKKYFDRIFVIFQRLHTQEEFPGEGIGLATCKKVLDQHGGRIWIESELGKGSAFYFSLPHSEEGV